MASLEDQLKEAWNLLESSPKRARESAAAIVAEGADLPVAWDARALIGTTYIVEGDNAGGVRHLLALTPDLRDRGEYRTLGQAYAAIAMAYGGIGNVEETLRFHQLNLEVRREHGTVSEHAMALGHLGITFSELGDDVSALGWFDQAIALYRTADDSGGEATALVNASHSHIMIGDYPTALAGIERGLELFGDSGGAARLAFAHQQLCTAARLDGQYEKAEKAGLRALEMAREIGLESIIWPSLMAMGRLYLDRGWFGADPAQGLQMLDDALAQATDKPSLIEMRKILADACAAEGEYEAALAHQRALTDLRDGMHKQNAAGQLAMMKAELEVENLHRHAAELEALNEELGRANAAKSEFLAVASHDLKNALSAVLMTTELLTRDAVAAQMSAEIIRQQTRRMIHLIDNLLDADAIESGKRTLTLDNFDLAALAKEITSSFQAAAAGKDIRIEVRAQGRCRVFADRGATSQILENLVSNALKFSPRWGAVTLVVTDRVLSVQDEGPGFTAADHDKMFKRFARLSAQPTGDEPSTGLGLSIVQNLARAMGGEITAKNGPHRGAHMTLELLESRQ